VVKQAVLHAEGITRPITRYDYVAVLRTMDICIVPLDERAMSMHLPKCYQSYAGVDLFFWCALGSSGPAF
jgi:hypothetical protein